MYKKTLSLCALSLISITVFAANAKHHGSNSMISGIFTISPDVWDEGLTAGDSVEANYEFTVTNSSGITQSNLIFTYPGTSEDANTCVNGMSLASGASCDLFFKITSLSAGTMDVGKRAGGTNAFPIQVCGFGGVGDDCSVPNQSTGVAETIVDPAVGGGEEGDGEDPPYVVVNTQSHFTWVPHALPLSANDDEGITNALAHNLPWKQWTLVGGEWHGTPSMQNSLFPAYNLAVPMITVSSDAVKWHVQAPSDLLKDGFKHGKISDLDVGDDGRLIAVGAEWNVDSYGAVAYTMPYAYSKSALSSPWVVTQLPMSQDTGNGKIYDVHHENKLWVAVGTQNMKDANDLLLHAEPLVDVSSDNGAHWVNHETLANTHYTNQEERHIALRSVDYANGLWVSVGHQSMSNGPIIETSSDGINWTPQLINNATGYDYSILRSVTNINGEWVAIGREFGSFLDDVLIMRSSDGVHWTRSFYKLESPYDFPMIYKIKAVGDKLIASGRTIDRIFGRHLPLRLQSDDKGLNWTMSILPITSKYKMGTLTSSD